MNSSVKDSFFSGITWTFIQNVAVKGISFCFTIFLARILTPDDYGLLGMLAIFTSISQVLISSGFSDALVQKIDVSEEDYSTAFIFNFLISILAYTVLYVAAPYIASFYNEQQLCVLLRVSTLNIVFGSLNLVQCAKLTKAMNFRSLALITLFGTIIGGLVGVFLAYYGYGVWALVFQTLLSTLLSVFLYPFFSKWTPKFLFSLNSLSKLWRFGSRLIVTGLSSAFILNLSSILIGRYYKSAQVGYYTRAQGFGDLPSTILFSIISGVSYSALCNVQSNKERMLILYKKILKHTVLVTCPIIFCLVILSKPLIIVLLTDKWLPCVPLLRYLLLARMFLPIGSIHIMFLRSIGRPDLDMKLYFVTGPLSLCAIVFSIPFGVKAMAFATFVAAMLSYIVTSCLINRICGYGIFNQLKDWKKIIVSLFIYVTGIVLVVSLIENPIVQLLLGGIVGLSIYLFFCYIFELVDDDVINILKSKISFKRYD